MTTTPIKIIYHFKDGRRESLGTGTIDNSGIIDITAPRSGQEDYVKTEMGELNARDHVVLKEPPPADAPRGSVAKHKIYRDSVDFLPALKVYGMRVYGMEFVFDISRLLPGFGKDDPADGALEWRELPSILSDEA
ncbi:hypothetical protein Z946_3106 [Sulfitobacter noctilucicola]|uniref:Uncharacterized protein n=1 Tax=Sulfitobacter noctilucicola TaxID=1342301 RepID=A0A7W6Q5B7_9RHOB|nr:hypothetical protein [Sulfitobacter noctilucicola]KIN64217.1 hypothetical protein Z946_3106 [Sulfitobacter noctilucicola]MBB4175568.1 hypothetical protein [Sulfitobacter noctilucicola]